MAVTFGGKQYNFKHFKKSALPLLLWLFRVEVIYTNKTKIRGDTNILRIKVINDKNICMMFL